MKDKLKRDKEYIAWLTASKAKVEKKLNDKDEVARKLIALIKTEIGGCLNEEMFEIVKDDHFLRKHI